MPVQKSQNNRLLRELPTAAFDALRPYMEKVALPLKTVLVEPNEVTSHVFFLESGLGSMTVSSPDGEVIEVGHIGRDGMAGSHLVLMSRRTPNQTFMQVAGSAIAIPSSRFAALLDENSDARRLMLRYVQAYQIQLAYTSLANTRYAMSQRLARWLLMCHDRLVGDELPLTHEFLSIMLGVRRPGVTEQLHILEGLQTIRSTRGLVLIRDRAKLERIAGSCYGVPEKEYERLIGDAPEEKPEVASSGLAALGVPASGGLIN